MEELRFKPRRRKEKGGKNKGAEDKNDKALKELEALDRKEGKAKPHDKQ